MAKLLEYRDYLNKMVAYHKERMEGSYDPYHAIHCKQQYFAFRQALEEFEHVLCVMGV